VERLTDDAALADFADSITVMRVRDRIKRQTGRNLSILEIADSGTVGKLIEILQSRTPEKAEEKRPVAPRRQGPPEIDDMVHLVEEPELFDATKEIITKTIESFGFKWNDVQDVMPAYDFATVLASTGIMDSWNFKFAMLPKAMDKKVCT
jgi:aryl carrier-like protein